MIYPTYFKRTKYNAHKKEYKGSMYHSTDEANYARILDTMKRAANPAQRVVKWERQVPVPLVVEGVTIATWHPDFRVWFADGRDEWHEVKSPATVKDPTYRIKEKLFRALFPKRTLLIVML